MRAAMKTLKTVLVVSLAAAGGCEKNDAAQNQSISIDNASPAEIEALPPDESSATPTNELANGADNADVTDLNATNSD